MKKQVGLILVVALMLSGCGIPHSAITDTAVVESVSETVKPENPDATSETTWPTTQTSTGSIQETTQTSTGSIQETTQTSTESIQETTQTSTESTETETQPTSETTHDTTKTPSKTTAETTADPTPEVSQTTSQSPDETMQVTVETSQKVEETTEATDHETTVDLEYSIMLKRDVLVLMMAYPESVAGVETIDKSVYLVMRSGKRLLYDDRKMKTFDEKITDADLQDMLETLYPLSENKSLMSTNFDPGRTRAYAFLDELYGNSKDVISGRLMSVDFGDEHLLFNQAAGAAAALAATAGDAASLVVDQPQIADYLYPTSGTFNYRVIAGTNRLSPHAYGIAIDLKSSPYGYWLWASPAEGETFIKTYPQDLVRLFEKHGFIWGGKWNHFDLFHFEYRPEIIIKATYFSQGIDASKPWYQGANMNSETVSEMIALIDKSLG